MSNIALIRYIGDSIHVITLVMVATFIFPVFSIITLLSTKQSPIKTIKELWKDKVLMAVAIPDTFWVLFYIPLALRMNIGLLDAILVSATALTVIAGVVILKEKVRWYSYIIIAIILGCAVAISLLN